MLLLSAHNLSYHHGDMLLLNDVDISLYGGDKIVLLGRSGSGKSLLLQALGDLLTLDKGGITLQSIPLIEIAPAVYRSQVSLFHQSPQFFDGTVLQNLQAPFDFKYYQAKQFDIDWHIAKLSHFGRSAQFLQQSVHKLSGGERQIVGFLCSLQLNPMVALFDEVTSALDGETADALIQLVCEWHDETKALLWVTHTPNEQLQLGAKVWQMHNGQLMDTTS